MKRVMVSFGAIVLFALAVCGFAAAQSDSTSLGDYARKIKKNKPQETQDSAKVYDNDNLPGSTAISVVGAPDAPKDAKADAKSDAKADPKSEGNTDSKADSKSDAASSPSADASKDPAKDALKIKPDQSAQERKKAYDAWKQRIDDHKKKVDQLARDLSDLQGKTPAAIMPDDYKQKYKQDLAEKQKALDDAKAALNALLDQAHQSGVPSSVTE